MANSIIITIIIETEQTLKRKAIVPPFSVLEILEVNLLCWCITENLQSKRQMYTTEQKPYFCC